MSPTPDRPRLAGAAEIGEEFGLSAGSVNRLYAQRAETEFPEVSEVQGRTRRWEHRKVTAWFAEHRAPGAKSRLQHLAAPAGTDDPGELLNASQVARLLGYKNPNQITAYLRDHPGYFPDPDHAEELGTPERPWRRQQWRRATVTDWAATRPGKGKHSGPPRSAPPLPDVPPDGDPDELLTAPEAAALLNFKSVNTFSSSLSQGNLPLLEQDDGTKPGSRGRPRRVWTRRRILEQAAQRRAR